MNYIINIAPGIEQKLFAKWFLKSKVEVIDDGFTLCFDETCNVLRAFKDNQDKTHLYCKTHSKNFYQGLPKVLINEYDKVKNNVFTDLNKLNSNSQALNVFYGNFSLEVLNFLQNENNKIYNIIININLSYSNTNLNDEEFEKHWDFIFENKFKCLKIDHIMTYQPFRNICKPISKIYPYIKDKKYFISNLNIEKDYEY